MFRMKVEGLEEDGDARIYEILRRYRVDSHR